MNTVGYHPGGQSAETLGHVHLPSTERTSQGLVELPWVSSPLAMGTQAQASTIGQNEGTEQSEGAELTETYGGACRNKPAQGSLESQTNGRSLTSGEDPESTLGCKKGPALAPRVGFCCGYVPGAVVAMYQLPSPGNYSSGTG